MTFDDREIIFKNTVEKSDDLSILVQYTQRVYEKSVAKIDIKIYDKNQNKLNNFNQNYGFIQNANIEVTILSGDNQEVHSSEGVVNDKGFFETEFFVPEKSRETFTVTINAENDESKSSKILQIFSLGEQPREEWAIEQKTKCIKKFYNLLLHGTSLVIGAGIASIVFTIAFFGFNEISNETELVIEPVPTIQEEGPPKVTINTFLANGSPVLGNPNAQITLVEFGDYQCHFCNVFFHSTEDSILKNYVETGKVKMIFKDFNIIGPDSINASHGAHCAGDQGMFWEYHDILYSNWTGENNGWASSKNLLKFAQEIGLDIEMWSECMTDARHSQTIVASNEDAQTLELTGTPSFFVIGPDGKTTKLFGAQPYDVFVTIFENKFKK
ncbi:MAG: DsbA family protein [Nitrosopumilus sp.]